MFSNTSIALVLAASLMGCPKKGPDLTSPVDTFNEGVRLLQSAPEGSAADFGAAYTMFEASITADPGRAKAQYNAGWTAEQQGFKAKAAQHYRTALNLSPGYSNALFSLGIVLTELGKGAEAAELYKDYLQKTPDDIAVRNNLVEALTGAQAYEEALDNIRVILRADNTNVGAYRNLSRIYFKMGKLEMSQLCAEKAKTLAKGDSGIYNNIGVTFLVMGDKQAAISEFKTATKLDPANVPANLNLGYLAIDSGDYELGFKSFSAVASSEPGNIAGKLGLAVSLRGKKDFEAAGKLYDEVIAADPKNEAAYFNAATLHRKYTKNFKKASKYLDAYVAAFQGQIDPGHPVFERKALVQKAIDAETAKKAEANRRKQEAEERKKRQRKVFEDLKVKVASLDALLTKYGSCELMIEMGGIDMGQMVLEQAQMVVEAEEIDMAADVMTFMDDLLPQLQSNTAFCDDEFSAKAAAAPAEAAPAEAAPAEAAPAEAAPAEATE